ncbi:hypothetical protein [Nocardia huaxiensis]|uniref:hypothetical protein n=1 Tax=Nocardia huaxiensis TaxID=2755382 RepID=UPI001E54D1E9|nr:hypothetical protein [Nocardia huaxiensis]UFS95711.1 hypothetical protein LPY97_34430 [Nocardia huaxiensis]
MTRKDAMEGELLPTAHAVAGRGRRRRAEFLAGWILGTLALLVVVGWLAAPGESANAVGPLNPTPAPPPGDGTLTYTAVTAPSVGAGAVTATILGFMIAGAMLIGLLFFSPTPDRTTKRRQPRRSGAVVTYYLLRQAYSSIAPGAVLETVMRNSTLLLVFFNRSTSRSMA